MDSSISFFNLLTYICIYGYYIYRRLHHFRKYITITISHKLYYYHIEITIYYKYLKSISLLQVHHYHKLTENCIIIISLFKALTFTAGKLLHHTPYTSYLFQYYHIQIVQLVNFVQSPTSNSVILALAFTLHTLICLAILSLCLFKQNISKILSDLTIKKLPAMVYLSIK